MDAAFPPRDFAKTRGVAVMSVLAGTAIWAAGRALPETGAFATALDAVIPAFQGVELLAVVISALVVSVSFHSLEREDDHSARLLIYGFSVIAVYGLLHTLNAAQPDTLGSGVFYWIVVRTFEAATLAMVALNVALPFSRVAWFGAAILTASLVFWYAVSASASYAGVFIPGVGSTPSKVNAEYALAGVNGIAAFVFWRRAGMQRSQRDYLLAAGSLLMGLSGLAVARYGLLSNVTLTTAHLLRALAYLLVYRAAFAFAIKEPHALLRRSEAELRESQEQLRAIGDNLPNGLVYQMLGKPDGTRKFLYVSAGVERLHGASVEEVLADASVLYERIEEVDRNRVRMAEIAAHRSMSVFDIVIHVRGAGDIPRTLHLCSQPRRLKDGTVVWDGVAIDVTERERAENELKRLNTELEERVAERTSGLVQAVRSLESFTHIIAHDLKAPARHMEAFATLLDRECADGFDERGRHLLQRIMDASRNMNRQIDGMLAVARMEEARLVPQEADLSALCTVIAGELSESAPDRHVEWTIQSGLKAKADVTLMRNALTNLLGNAWKFTAERPSAHIQFGAIERQGERVYFVRDNGAGFSSSEADRLFTLFQRLHTQGQFGGLGIGLVSAKAVIASHGGRIWAEGAVGEGATVYFTLPDRRRRERSTSDDGGQWRRLVAARQVQSPVAGESVQLWSADSGTLPTGARDDHAPHPASHDVPVSTRSTARAASIDAPSPGES
jgi:signal transduction histidine kinase